MKVKKMPVVQFEAALKRSWTPIQLVGDAIPDWAKGIPEDKLHSIRVSGTMTDGLPYESKQIPSNMLIGGIDIYRHSPDDPVELNKDWYAVVVDPDHDNMLLVDGPFKDTEHWLDDIPSRLKGIEVYGVLKKPKH